MANIFSANQKQINENAVLSNALNNQLLMRVKKNMHFMLTFTPSGQNFRQKMQQNQGLMTNAQIIFIQNLTSDCLWQIGEQSFLPKMEEEAQFKLHEDKNRDTRLDQYNLSVARDTNEKVLKAMV
jgi:hypothetical protein